MRHGMYSHIITQASNHLNASHFSLTFCRVVNPHSCSIHSFTGVHFKKFDLNKLRMSVTVIFIVNLSDKEEHEYELVLSVGDCCVLKCDYG